MRIPARHLWITKWVNGVHVEKSLNSLSLSELYVNISHLIDERWCPTPTLAVPRPHSPCNPYVHSWLTEFAVENLKWPWRIWNCRSEFKFAAANVTWWVWICRSEIEFTVVHLKLLCRVFPRPFSHGGDKALMGGQGFVMQRCWDNFYWGGGHSCNEGR